MAAGRRIIVVGDTNSSGGTVISGSSEHTVGGRPIARLHDAVDCPGKYPDGSPHGMNPIVEGEEHMPINGLPVALEGHRSSCGCRLIGSSNASYGGDGSSTASGAGDTPQAGNALAADEQIVEQYYELTDGDGRPVDGFRYDMYKYGALHTHAANFAQGRTVSIERFALVDVTIWNKNDRFESNAQ